jgi:hypothetical protein
VQIDCGDGVDSATAHNYTPVRMPRRALYYPEWGIRDDGFLFDAQPVAVVGTFVTGLQGLATGVSDLRGE